MIINSLVTLWINWKKSSEFCKQAHLTWKKSCNFFKECGEENKINGFPNARYLVVFSLKKIVFGSINP